MREILVTGGAGFIGSNLVETYLKKGESVTVFDNLCRDGSKLNLEWLKLKGGKLKIIEGDVRNPSEIEKCVKGKDLIFHLAAQVAVTTSVTDPRTDFEVNAIGTLNVLEATRRFNPKAIIVYSSTNKVYGEMISTGVVEKETRYDYQNLNGVSEEQPLDFHSPYGCSKGAADDLCRAYELAIEKISVSRGKIYNIGGGRGNSLSIWYGLRLKLEKLFGHKISAKFSDWRPGDQKIFISDNRLIEQELNWKSTVSIDTGLKKLFDWVQENKNLFT